MRRYGTDAGPDVIEILVREDERLAEPGDDTLDHASRLIAELGVSVVVVPDQARPAEIAARDAGVALDPGRLVSDVGDTARVMNAD